MRSKKNPKADLNKKMLPQAPTIYKIENGKLIEKNLKALKY